MDARATMLVLVAISVGVAALWLHRRRPKQQARRRVRALLLACKGDQELVERLIFVEMQRNENIDYAEAARRALARLARDRR